MYKWMYTCVEGEGLSLSMSTLIMLFIQSVLSLGLHHTSVAINTYALTLTLVSWADTHMYVYVQNM